MRRGGPTSGAAVYSEDRAVQALQRELKTLRQQIRVLQQGELPRRPRTRPIGAGAQSFRQQGRGRYSLTHEVDLFPQAAHNDHSLLIPELPLELTSAYWVPDEDWTSSPTNYSWIRLEERQKAFGYPQSGQGWRLLGYISGEPKATGPWATGDLLAQKVYRFRLEERPIVQPESLFVADSERETAVNTWPTGYIVVNWRYLE